MTIEKIPQSDPADRFFCRQALADVFDWLDQPDWTSGLGGRYTITVPDGQDDPDFHLACSAWDGVDLTLRFFGNLDAPL